MKEELTIQQVAERSGLSAHTLRYYERIGLLEPVGRAKNGHRRYSVDDLGWLELLQCLRATGMSIRQMQEFAQLRRQGAGSIPERLAFLEAHRQQVQQDLSKLEGYLAMITRKVRGLQEHQQAENLQLAVRN